MKIGLLDVDGHNFPNIAIMKLSAWHKSRGDDVEWYNGLEHYDRVYMSKVFSFTSDDYRVIQADEVIKGGSGYKMYDQWLPDEIEHICPDYSLYPMYKEAYGFLTRGCVNKCSFCIVPRKEGIIRKHADITEFLDGKKEAILMDNNILASDYGLKQIEKIASLKLKVDFNQGLDARLVTEDVAKLLAKVKWIKRIRFGCDTPGQIEEVEKAISLINKYGYKGEYFLYCILMDFKESFKRVNHWRSRKGIYPHCQPFRDISNPRKTIPQWQMDLARWADRKELFRTCEFEDYEPRKGFFCKEYFN